MEGNLKPVRKKKKVHRDDFFGGSPRSLTYIVLLTIFASIVNFFDGWATSVMAFALPVDPVLEAGQTIYDYFNFTMYDFHVAMIFIVAGLGVMSAIVFKWAADKYGRKPLYLITAIGFTGFTVLTAFVPPGSQFFPVFLFIRYFANLFLAADLVLVIIAEEAPSKYRGRLISLTVSLNLMGALTVTILHFYDIQFLWFATWQSMFFLNIIGFAFVLPIYIFMKETKRFKNMKKYEKWKEKKRKEKELVVKKRLLERPWFVPLQKRYLRPLLLSVVPYVGISMIMIAVLQYMPFMLANELLIPNWELLMIPFLITGFGALFFTLYVMDRWDRKVLALRGALLMFLGGLLIAVPSAFIHPPLPYGSDWAAFLVDFPQFGRFILAVRPIAIALMISGFCIGSFGGPMTISAISVMPLEMMPTHILSTATGWWSFFQKVPTILSPTIIFWGAMMIGRPFGVQGGLTFAWSYFSIGIFLITAIYTIVYLAPPRGTSKGKSIEEIIFTQEKVGLKRERSRKYEYTLLISTYVIYFFCTFVYGAILSVPYFGFNPIIPIIQVLLIEGFTSIGLMAIVVYVREKVVGVAPYIKKKSKKAKVK